jgi:hypothetical protein
MSTFERSLTLGCCILTATTEPSCKIALCTWANDAVPIGFVSIDLKISVIYK